MEYADEEELSTIYTGYLTPVLRHHPELERHAVWGLPARVQNLASSMVQVSTTRGRRETPERGGGNVLAAFGRFCFCGFLKIVFVENKFIKLKVLEIIRIFYLPRFQAFW